MKPLGTSSKMSSPRAISEPTMRPVVPYTDPQPAPRNRGEPPVVGDAVLQRSLGGRPLVVARERHLVVLEREDRVGSPLHPVRRAALGTAATAPLVGEENLRAVVVERGRVPEGEVRVGDGADALRVPGVGDVEEESVPAARAPRPPPRR